MENAIGFSQRIQNLHRAAFFQLLPQSLSDYMSRERKGLIPGKPNCRRYDEYHHNPSPTWKFHAKTRDSMPADLFTFRFKDHGPYPLDLRRLDCRGRPDRHSRRKKHQPASTFTPRSRLGISRSSALRAATPSLPRRARPERVARVLPD